MSKIARDSGILTLLYFDQKGFFTHCSILNSSKIYLKMNPYVSWNSSSHQNWRNIVSINHDFISGGAVGGEVDSLRTYQNQTAEDIESGRARMDSVTSYGSGGSEEALLPEVRVANGLTSPRRTNRENLPLLRGRGHQRLTEYEDIDVESANVFQGMNNLFKMGLKRTKRGPKGV